MRRFSIGVGLIALGFVVATGSAQASPVNGTGLITPDVLYGAGNDNGSYTGETSGNIEVGLRAHQRYPPASTYNYDGVDTYVFDSTVLTTNPANRSVFNFDWSVNVNQDGTSTNVLADFSYKLSVDTDPTAAVSFLTIDPFNTPGYFDHSLGDNSTPNGGGVESSSNADLLANMLTYSIAQQSSNLGFGFSSDPDQPGIYDIKFEVFNLAGDTLLASAGIRVVVEPVPLPGALPLLASVLGIGGFAIRRRRQKTA